MSVLSPSKVLLLDEIVAALDPLASDSVMALIDEIVRSEGRTTLMVTHNMAHAIKYGDRILLLGRRGILREFRGEEKESLIPSRLAKMLSGA
jgi:putative ABC transport system ATP-binding protein